MFGCREAAGGGRRQDVECGLRELDGADIAERIRRVLSDCPIDIAFERTDDRHGSVRRRSADILASSAAPSPMRSADSLRPSDGGQVPDSMTDPPDYYNLKMLQQADLSRVPGNISPH